ncbi:GNAT family N-acetyltransferase [Rhizobium sp. SSA_523]|uniref:GNAT family N-acetyltransferase n=1 Tax=Rhizobium sp. SSA_523 TaxID=2952477 RepID=UPI002090D459|nr:GNAT family N-acetyltransferase [Rhizobium sp. SSA_523]MCO5730597.1 GNAT family N-acetyltransferase [Rhizobium sp. SSA_523]WKC24569.1 GNAT family N-acetyltransferase [Rhizobium sp. SSA_523]
MDGGTIVIRKAREEDLPDLVALFAEDALGGHGDTTDPEAHEDYLKAFHAIDASAQDHLFVCLAQDAVVGTFQISFLRSLPGRGALNMRIEAVQTRADLRGQGIGARMIAHALEEGRRHGCKAAYVISNARRTDAHRFYERLGFAPSHAGFRMPLK